MALRYKVQPSELRQGRPARCPDARIHDSARWPPNELVRVPLSTNNSLKLATGAECDVGARCPALPVHRRREPIPGVEGLTRDTPVTRRQPRHRACIQACGIQRALSQALGAVSQSQQTAAQLQREAQLDNPTVSLEETMVAMQKAQLGFQATLQVRNRLVQAYSNTLLSG